MIASNVILAALKFSVEKLLFLGSACIYPRDVSQPIKEDMLMSGPLEPTNEWYSVAKIAGVKLIQAYRRQYKAPFISAQPINLYGPFDNFDSETGHVLPALLKRAHEAKVWNSSDLVVWGSGNPLREFMHVSDVADAMVFLMRYYNGSQPLNVGTGEEISIAELAHLICNIVGFSGKLKFDSSRPDGVLRKRLDTTRLSSLGWKSSISLEFGIRDTYRWLLNNKEMNFR